MTGFPLAILIPLTTVAAGATLYFVNQSIALFSRFREGYAYGLAYEGSYIGFNPNQENAVLQLGVTIRNVSAKPLRYIAERFDVVVEDRTIAVPTFQSTGGIIPHATARQYFYPPFRKAQVEDFIGKTVQGSITFEFLYGHPEAPSVRRLAMKLSIFPRLDEKFGIRDLIVLETDEPERQRH